MSAVANFEAKALFRDNIFGSELVWNETRYVFPSKRGKKSMKNLFMFSMVKRDALKYLKTHTLPNIEWSPSVIFNEKINAEGRKLTGADIDGAYWHIANSMGIISDKTYYRGIETGEKHLLLASLSSLGRDKRYTQMVDGKFTQDIVIVKGNDELKKLYKKIRFTCFKYMRQLAKIIGKDFVAYKTDCIYFLHSAENVHKVKDFLHKKEIDFKMVSDYKNFSQFAEAD